MTRLFKFLSFLILAFALGYGQGWWRSYQNINSPHPLVILTLESYRGSPLLQKALWEKLEKVIPYKIHFEILPQIGDLISRVSHPPTRAHLVLLERQDLLQLKNYFDSFSEFSDSLLDSLKSDFHFEPHEKYFPILWRSEECLSQVSSKDKIWGFLLPRNGLRASQKGKAFIIDLTQNPMAFEILQLTQDQIPFQKENLLK